MEFISYGHQNINELDISAVNEALTSNFLTQGPIVQKFEEKISQYCGVKHSLVTNSATSALHLSCLALGLQENDLVWTSPISFVASANCAVYCGAKVDFVDINPNTYNISTSSLSEKLSRAKLKNRLPKILIVVHLAGQSCEMEEIYRLAKEYDFKIIEDASHAIGGKYKNSPIGDCKYSDIVVFSFHPVKIITTGEGGACLTNNTSLAEKISRLRSHGIVREQNLFLNNCDGPWYYEQIELGFNYRMTDIQAALGISQLKRIDEFISARRKIVNEYKNLLKDLPVTVPHENIDSFSSFHLYILKIKFEEINVRKKDVFNSMLKNNIGVNLHYIPIYKHPFYKKMIMSQDQFPEAESYYKEAMTIPLYPGLKEEQLVYIVKSLKEALAV
jgi:UDP-4-amino-4,6-dideoxy-N-acetyl-beta-L-altrosamine transaminase